MALIITLRNISDLAPTSDYEAVVWLNDTRIDGPFIVRGHRRSDGYRELVRALMDELDRQPRSKPRKH